MLTNRMFNATPFRVKFPWDKGINITIEPDGYLDLSNAQLADFQPGQPGSETVQTLMNDFGLFLRDTDRTFEAQCLDALKACRRSKNSHFEESTNNLRRSRAAAGIVDNPDALEETFRQLGLSNLRDQVQRLDSRIRMVEAEVAKQKTSAAKVKFDPERTLLFTNPPRVFETPFAMKMFLADPANAALKAQWEAWKAAMEPKDEQA